MGKRTGEQNSLMRWMTCRLAAMAFRQVLGVKQTKYRDVTAWLDDQIKGMRLDGAAGVDQMDSICRRGNDVFRGYKY